MTKRPSLEYLKSRIRVDISAGKVFWLDATKYHNEKNGSEAGCKSYAQFGKSYWHVKIDSFRFKRGHLVFLFAHGRWPRPMLDHINGDSLDDRISNIREATATQNAWNHKTRKKHSELPMGIRTTKNGRYQARIACNKKTVHLGTFVELDKAVAAYQNKRKELFGEFA